jgi:hypothetical protein
MTEEFAKRSLAAVVTTAALALAAVTPVGAAGQSDNWFEHQRSVTEGAGLITGPKRQPRALTRAREVGPVNRLSAGRDKLAPSRGTG